MGLIELCLLSVLSPQQPAGGAEATPAARAPAAERPAQATVPATPKPSEQEPQQPQSPPQPQGSPKAEAQPVEAQPQDPVVTNPKQRLRAAEEAGEQADAAELAALAKCDDAAVAARAAWLLANSDNPDHPRALPDVAENSPHAEARLQAMKQLLKTARPAFAALAVDRLADEDRRVRTLAVQVLAKLRNPVAIDPLVSLIDDHAADAPEGTATDLQAAVLALTDFGAAEHLLRIATSIHDGDAQGTGEALTFAYQTLSPGLATADELTLLVAALDHREPMLRRYAITRLAELDDPTSIGALEGRLAAEGNELRPLIENALAQLRRDKGDQVHDEVARAKANATVLWKRTVRWWNGLEPLHQGLVAGAPALLIVLLMMMRRRARRRANEQEGLAAAAMVAPSDEYYEDEEDAYYDDGEYDEAAAEEGYDEEYEDGDYGEEAAEYDDDQYEEGDYDTSGWQEDEEDETLLAEGGLDDERFR